MIINKEKNFISAVVYVRNNENQIGDFLQIVNTFLESNFEKYEIICVNDNSKDRSFDVIKEFSKNTRHTMLSIINMSFYQGLELSMNAGVDLAIGDFVFEFDTVHIDYELDIIMNVYQQSLRGYDIVSAAPKNIKRNTSRLFYFVFNHFSEKHYKLRTEAFRILSRRAINRIHSISTTIPYRKAIYANCGLKIHCIIYTNISFNNTSMDSWTFEKRQNMAMDSLILFTDIGYKISFFMSSIMMLTSILMGIYTITIFIENQPVAGWTTTMLFLSFGFGGMFGITGIIIKYLAILIDLVFKKKSYMIESIEKLTK